MALHSHSLNKRHMMQHSDTRFPINSSVRTPAGHIGTVREVIMHECACHLRDAALVRVMVPYFGHDCTAAYAPCDLTPLPNTDSSGMEWRVRYGQAECKNNTLLTAGWTRPSYHQVVWTEERVRLLYALFEAEKGATQSATTAPSPR